MENFGRFLNITSKSETDFKLRRQIWSCGLCRLKFYTYWVKLTMAKTGCNIQNSKSDLRLHNFREVQLGNKQINGNNKLTV